MEYSILEAATAYARDQINGHMLNFTTLQFILRYETDQRVQLVLG